MLRQASGSTREPIRSNWRRRLREHSQKCVNTECLEGNLSQAGAVADDVEGDHGKKPGKEHDFGKEPIRAFGVPASYRRDGASLTRSTGKGFQFLESPR